MAVFRDEMGGFSCYPFLTFASGPSRSEACEYSAVLGLQTKSLGPGPWGLKSTCFKVLSFSDSLVSLSFSPSGQRLWMVVGSQKKCHWEKTFLPRCESATRMERDHTVKVWWFFSPRVCWTVGCWLMVGFLGLDLEIWSKKKGEKKGTHTKGRKSRLPTGG